MERILGHQTLKSATYTWPGYLPSPSLTPLLFKEAPLLTAEMNDVKVVLLSFMAGGVKGITLGTSELVKYFLAGQAVRILIVLCGYILVKTAIDYFQ